MRKLSILQENYMALEQTIAEALHVATTRLSQRRTELKEALSVALSSGLGVGEYHKTPEFINFKNGSGIKNLIEEVQESILRIPLSISKDKVTTLSKAAVIGKVHDELTGVNEDDYDSSVDEVTGFYGRKNTNIPDSSTGDFQLQVSDKGKQEGIRKFIDIHAAMQDARETIISGLNGGVSPEELTKAIDVLAILKELASVYSE